MLYKFKSRSTADLILLEPHGRRLLQIMGKDPGPTGIITVAQIPAAVAALEAAVLAEERIAATQSQEKEAQAQEEGDEAEAEGNNPAQGVSLRQRAAPFIEMLRRSAQGGHDVVWGA